MPAEIGGPTWNGWGAGLANTRYQLSSGASIAAAAVPKLTLKWVFGFGGALGARTQPTVVAGRLFTGSERGEVYALDAQTGCVHWMYRARAAVRTAMTVAPYRSSGASTRFALYFGDGQANAYAVDAETGSPLWVRKVEEHPNAAITGAPAVYEGRVYVPTSAAGEEVRGGRLDYGCCTFRGSVSALDALTGAVIWKSYSIAEAAKPRGKNKDGVQLFGPAGGGIWGAPTIDARRGVLYVGTGNGFAEPAQPTTNAVLAFELEGGRLRWVKQTVPNDVWIWQCPPESPDNPNCPRTQGPDFDFGTSPLIARTPQGRELLVRAAEVGRAVCLRSGQERGRGVGLPLRAGERARRSVGCRGRRAQRLRWQQRFAVAIARRNARRRSRHGQASVVRAAADETVLGRSRRALLRRARRGAHGDSGCRLLRWRRRRPARYSTRDGSIVWQVDTNREFTTVNGVKANGATIDGAGPVVVDGWLFVNSGYGGIVGRAGNALLAFHVE